MVYKNCRNSSVFLKIGTSNYLLVIKILLSRRLVCYMHQIQQDHIKIQFFKKEFEENTQLNFIFLKDKTMYANLP